MARTIPFSEFSKAATETFLRADSVSLAVLPWSAVEQERDKAELAWERDLMDDDETSYAAMEARGDALERAVAAETATAVQEALRQFWVY
jgi:hypothetical protein